MAKQRKVTEEEFKTAHEALEAARASFSAKDDWRVRFKNDHNIKTAADLQAFIIFNMLRAILEKIDPTNERLFLNTIQQNFLYSTFKFKEDEKTV